MGLFDSLFGSGTKQLNKSAGVADQRLIEARRQAEAALGQGRADLGAGFDKAEGIYAQAAPGMRADLMSGFDGADSMLREGYGAATDAVTSGRDDANSRLDPFVQSGLGAQGLYDQAIGVGGADKAKDFYQNYAANDPFRQFRDDLATRELERKYNAQGSFQGGGAAGGGSGRFATAASRASLERGTQDLQTYMDRLERAGARGGQYAGQQGQNSMTAGAQIGQLQANQGTALAGNSAQRGSALSGLSMNLADRTSSLATGRGAALSGNSSALADLAYGHGQQRAANEINLGNATSAARRQPGQNLIGLAGIAASMYGMPKLPKPGGGGIGGAMSSTGGGWNNVT